MMDLISTKRKGALKKLHRECPLEFRLKKIKVFFSVSLSIEMESNFNFSFIFDVHLGNFDFKQGKHIKGDTNMPEVAIKVQASQQLTYSTLTTFSYSQMLLVGIFISLFLMNVYVLSTLLLYVG